MPDKATGRPKKNVKLRYDEKGMFWFNLETKEKQNPSMPGWAQRSGGEIDFNRFIKTWNNANNLEDVHKKFFWRTPRQLSRQRGEISEWLEAEDIFPLKTLSTKAGQRKRWSNQMSKLLDEGELTRKRSHAK